METVQAIIIGTCSGFLASVITDSWGADALTNGWWWGTLIAFSIMFATVRVR